MRHLAFLALTILASACASAPPPIPPDPFEQGGIASPAALQVREVGDEIIICGERVSTGAPVVLWSDPGGYDGYDTRIRPETAPDYVEAESGRRYRPGRTRGDRTISANSRDSALLATLVDQFVLHFDVCGVSSTCFRVLHHQRGLSAHFLLDVDGTIYQTLDVRETAWHATKANARSIGIEIAHIGSRLPDGVAVFDEWYSTDEQGVYLDLPERLGDGGVRTPNFRGRPARPGLHTGRINGSRLLQYDFTPEQYDSLARLCAALSAKLPRIELRFPRAARGEVLADVMDDRDFEGFSGILGHYHVQLNKVDPGPAFDWTRLQREARAYLEGRL